MSTNEIYNQKILELISVNRCNLSNANLETFDENILNFTNIEALILCENRLSSLSKDIDSQS